MVGRFNHYSIFFFRNCFLVARDTICAHFNTTKRYITTFVIREKQYSYRIILQGNNIQFLYVGTIVIVFHNLDKRMRSQWTICSQNLIFSILLDWKPNLLIFVRAHVIMTSWKWNIGVVSTLFGIKIWGDSKLNISTKINKGISF